MLELVAVGKPVLNASSPLAHPPNESTSNQTWLERENGMPLVIPSPWLSNVGLWGLEVLVLDSRGGKDPKEYMNE